VALACAGVDSLRLEHHLLAPQGRGRAPRAGHTGSAGAVACGDLVRISLAVEGDRVGDAGFEAAGCPTTQAAGSAAVALVRGRPLLEAARVGVRDVAGELGGLSPGKLHAAELAADALHRALGAAVRARAAVPPAPGRTLVAMSGGVDSAVAALEAARGGAGVAVTLELWRDPENDGERSCCSANAVRGARALAHSLGFPHFTLDLRDEFRVGVVEPWIAGHAAAETPNPCVRCNGSVRIDAMLALAERLGCEALATGHYARVAESDHPSGPLLRVAADAAKDQSYVLAALPAAKLARMRFPLGGWTKAEVRAHAADRGLPVAAKPDSQDLCFLAGTGRAPFLRRHGGLGERPGPIVDRRGRVLGRHGGQHDFTVGQRRGLGVAGAEPLYVLEKRGDRVVVGSRDELAATRVGLRDLDLRRETSRVNHVRLRSHARALPARLDGHTLELAEPALGAAPGQLACLMDGELVVGCATIDA
jgi:tRNA-uridine 2-sulfurtransferase